MCNDGEGREKKYKFSSYHFTQGSTEHRIHLIFTLFNLDQTLESLINQDKKIKKE